jgi:predicted permease
MANVLLIIISLLSGYILNKSKIIPENSYQVLNNLVIYICIPALSIVYIPKIQINMSLIFPLAVTWIVFLISVLIFGISGRILKWGKSTTGSLILTSGLCNTSFVGFPVLLAMFGTKGLEIGIIIDQAGSFVLLSTAGIVVASIYSSHKTGVKPIILNIIKYPPFIAFIAGIIILFFKIVISEFLLETLSKIGNTTFLLALVSVGSQLKFEDGFEEIKKLSAGLFYKLIIGPALIFLLYFIIFGKNNLYTQVSLIESAMPPMVMGSILASSYNLNPKLSNLMVGIGIPLSVITLFLWYLLINYL